MSRCYRALLSYHSHIAAITALSSAFLYYNAPQQFQVSSPFNVETPTSFKCIDTTKLFNLVPIKTHVASCKDRPSLSNFDFIADAAEIALPAVVSITVVKQLFVFEVKGNGSGFIVDKRGYIITNEHVIARAVNQNNITVVLGDGRKLEGRVVAVDSLTDLALVKIDTNIDLPELRMGDDSQLRAGQWVVAIGNSRHFPNTVTAGIISNTACNISEDYMVRNQAPTYAKVGHSKYIQTDAAVYQGGSGGPLVNLAGEVIAVNTIRGASGYRSSAGIGLSIPVSEVKRFLNEFFQGNINKQSSNDAKSTF